MAWAKLHKHWDFNMWKRVLWTDEALFITGGFGIVYITRLADEAYDLSCLIPKFRGFSSWMAHGLISGIIKGPLHIFEKVDSKTKVNSQIYIESVLPKLFNHIREM